MIDRWNRLMGDDEGNSKVIEENIMNKSNSWKTKL